MIVLILIVLLALIGPLLSSHDYAEQDVDRRNLPAKIPVLDQIPFLPFDGEGAKGVDAYKEAGVTENFWFGTDQLGRDLWSRTWQGAQADRENPQATRPGATSRMTTQLPLATITDLATARR